MNPTTRCFQGRGTLSVPSLVRVFAGAGPHFTDPGKTAIAKVYGDLYAKEP